MHGPVWEVACAVLKQGASFQSAQVPSWKADLVTSSWHEGRRAGIDPDLHRRRL
jgi:hypothetical protein